MRTFDRRLKTISIDIKERKDNHYGIPVCCTEGIVKPHILAIDSTFIKAHGKAWHKSSRNKGIITMFRYR